MTPKQSAMFSLVLCLVHWLRLGHRNYLELVSALQRTFLVSMQEQCSQIPGMAWRWNRRACPVLLTSAVFCPHGEGEVCFHWCSGRCLPTSFLGGVFHGGNLLQWLIRSYPREGRAGKRCLIAHHSMAHPPDSQEHRYQ